MDDRDSGWNLSLLAVAMVELTELRKQCEPSQAASGTLQLYFRVKNSNAPRTKMNCGSTNMMAGNFGCT